MKYFIFLLSFTLISTHLVAQLTRFEKTTGKETATYFEAIEWYKQLEKKSKIINVKEMGESDAGYPLHLVLLSTDGKFDPQKWRLQKKVIILINNGIHPGEPDGIDASMLLARDIINNKITLPSNVVLAIVPIYNIGGALNRNSFSRVNQNGPAEYGFRGNSQNLDLNRDFTKNDSKESKSFAKLFQFLDPDILIDNHVSDGADYQHTMTLITTQYDKLSRISGPWLRDVFEPQIYAGMKEKKWDLIPYVEFDGADFNKGINMFYEPPRYSSGYAALFGTFSFIPETHMLKPYAERVRSTYDLMLTFIERASVNADELLKKRKEAINEIIIQQKFPLRWVLDKTKNSSIIFKGYDQDSVTSEASNLKKMFYNHDKPYTKEVKYFNSYKPENIVEKPKAYIIPAGWHEVLDRFQLNGVVFKKIKVDTMVDVTYYKIEDFKSRPNPYEKHHGNYAVKVLAIADTIHFLKGDYLVEMNQRANRYIMEMLEPTGDDSFFAWNFFDAVLQQKEGYSNYRWDDIAAEVLKNDPSLKEKLELKKKAEPDFAKNGGAILNYIYKNSPYYEKEHMRYPVFRVEKVK
ncbi:MAG: M14 family zinc carboxypeptidase [Ferruginibacter sp.]